MIIETGLSEIDTTSSSPVPVGDLATANKLITELSNIHKAISYITIINTQPVPSGLEMVYSYLGQLKSDYDLARQKILDNITSMKMQLSNAISQGVISPQMITDATALHKFAVSERENLYQWASRLRAKIYEAFNAVKYPNSANSYFVQKEVLPVAPMPSEAEKLKQEILENTKKQAIANPVLAGSVIITFLMLFKK